mmetsp:Transcript_19162/g.55679  ORF Transcript_19162/g.55679 Transcript_19162/m.55679 type:complete len:298 (+) Transcript_19162:236-1129(+)
MRQRWGVRAMSRSRQPSTSWTWQRGVGLGRRWPGMKRRCDNHPVLPRHRRLCRPPKRSMQWRGWRSQILDLAPPRTSSRRPLLPSTWTARVAGAAFVVEQALLLALGTVLVTLQWKAIRHRHPRPLPLMPQQYPLPKVPTSLPFPRPGLALCAARPRYTVALGAASSSTAAVTTNELIGRNTPRRVERWKPLCLRFLAMPSVWFRWMLPPRQRSRPALSTNPPRRTPHRCRHRSCPPAPPSTHLPPPRSWAVGNDNAKLPQCTQKERAIKRIRTQTPVRSRMPMAHRTSAGARRRQI